MSFVDVVTYTNLVRTVQSYAVTPAKPVEITRVITLFRGDSVILFSVTKNKTEIRETVSTNPARQEPSFPSITDIPKKIQQYLRAGAMFPCPPDPAQLGKTLPVPIQAFSPEHKAPALLPFGQSQLWDSQPSLLLCLRKDGVRINTPRISVPCGQGTALL